MICKLCLKDKDLLKKSHIVPNFLYKELRDEDNSFLLGNLTDLKAKKLHTGYFEADILCKNCDNIILGKLENYASKILYGGKVKGVTLRNEINQHGVEFITCYGVDYKQFKLFLLSLIWRFSISKNEFYHFVNLGEHEEKIRKMILDGDAGDVLDYPCSICSYRRHTDLPFQIMSQPLKHRHNGGICYSVVMNGLLFTFYISKNLIPDYIAEIVVNKNNQLKVVNMPRENSVKIIRKYMRLPIE